MINKKRKGFTLSELLVVVLVIGILAAIATPMYSKAVRKSRASDALHVLSVAAAKQENYFVNNGRYAESLSDLSAPVKGLSAAKGSSVKVGNFTYALSESCVSATRYLSGTTTDYTIYKNFVTQQEGCTGEGCGLIKEIVPTVSTVGCPAVSGETETPTGPAEDPCTANPALCCPAGSTWDAVTKKCEVKNPCSDGKIFDPATKKCICNNSCGTDGVLDNNTCACSCPATCPLSGQVRDTFCNCVCPSDKPNWDGSKCTVGCSAPKTRWTGTECACPLEKPVWNGSACIQCPSHLTFDGTKCACPDGLPNEWGGRCYACSQASFNSGKTNCADTSSGPAGVFTDIMCSCSCNEPGSAFQGGKCVCVDPTPVWTGSKCEPCPDIQQWDGSKCVCPTSKPVWNGSKCEACPDIQTWDGSKCSCPLEKPVWNGNICEACPAEKPWDGTQCSCPRSLPYEYGGKCNQCPEGQDVSNGICCPAGQISEDGKTCVPACKAESTAWVTTTDTTDTCPGANNKGEYSCDGSFVGTCTDIRSSVNDVVMGTTTKFEFDPPSGYENSYYSDCNDYYRSSGKNIAVAKEHEIQVYKSNFAHASCSDLSMGYQYYHPEPGFHLIAKNGSSIIEWIDYGGIPPCPSNVDGNGLGCQIVCGLNYNDTHGCKERRRCYELGSYMTLDNCKDWPMGHPVAGNSAVFTCDVGDGGTKYKFTLKKCGFKYESRSVTCCAK